MKIKSFKPRQYNNVFVGLVILAISAIVPFANGTFSTKLAVAICFGTVGILTILHTLTQQLRFSTDSIKISGLLSRKIKYQDIACIKKGKVMYKSGAGAGYAGAINIVSKKEKQLSLLPMKFANYEGEHGWASILLNIVKEYPVSLDAELEQSLLKAVSSTNYNSHFLAK